MSEDSGVIVRIRLRLDPDATVGDLSEALDEALSVLDVIEGLAEPFAEEDEGKDLPHTLAKFSPKQWDEWLTWKADVYGAGYLDDIHADDMKRCLFCEAYYHDCPACIPGTDTAVPCIRHHRRERIDAAIERLEEAGIFDPDEDFGKYDLNPIPVYARVCVACKHSALGQEMCEKGFYVDETVWYLPDPCNNWGRRCPRFEVEVG